MATETQTPIETLKRAQIYNCRSADPEHCKLPICTDARAALEDMVLLVKKLGEMPCWSPYEGAYFTGCDNRLPPRMDSHSSFTDDERCRRCTALAKFQEAQP